MARSASRGISFAVLSAFMFSIYALTSKMLAKRHGVSPFVTSAMRAWIALFLVAATALWRRVCNGYPLADYVPQRRHVPHLFGRGLLSLCGQLLFNWGLSGDLPLADASALYQTIPVWCIVLSAAVFRRRLRWVTVGSLASILVG